MSESKFKHEVRKKWLPTYWSENIEDRTELGWPDEHFLGPTGIVTLVEFKYLPSANKNGTFTIPWRKGQVTFLLEYCAVGGNCGCLLRVDKKDYWVKVVPSMKWSKEIKESLLPKSEYLFPVSAANIKEFIK